jgi:hypothetical protein
MQISAQCVRLVGASPRVSCCSPRFRAGWVHLVAGCSNAQWILSGSQVHGVRPAHVGKQPVQRFFEPGLATTALEVRVAYRRPITLLQRLGLPHRRHGALSPPHTAAPDLTMAAWFAAGVGVAH